FQYLLHGLLLVLHRRLLDQDEVLEEGADTTLDNLGQGRFRLALFASGLLGDAALRLDDLGRYLVAGQVLGAHRGDLHGYGAPVGERGGEQRINVGRLRGGDVLNQTLRQRDEVGVLGDEVGLAVDLQQSRAAVRDQAVGGGTAGALADILRALDTQQLDGLV